jgi:CspA family cold shock protein
MDQPRPCTGTVREWRDEEGWGVLDFSELGEPCWVHFSVIHMDGFRHLSPGTEVTAWVEGAQQDGYRYRAVSVTPLAD